MSNFTRIKGLMLAGAVVVAGGLSGCADDNSLVQSSVPAAVPGSGTMLTGTLIDSPVQGVAYEITRASGEIVGSDVTNAAGEYQCFDADINSEKEFIKLSVGNIVLIDSMRCTGGVITPVELTSGDSAGRSTRPTSTAATNMLVFLQSIDSDRIPSNGILIPEATSNLATEVNLDFTSPDFDTEVVEVVTQITGGAYSTVVSEVDALTHFYDSAVAAFGSQELFPWAFTLDSIPGGDTGDEICEPGGDTGGSGALYDFEGGPASVDFDFFDGGMGEIVGNPDTVGNSSAYVVELKKAAGQPWGGGGVLVDPAIDLEANAVFTAKVWSQRAVPVTFKFESDDGAVQTFSVPHGGTGWEDLTFDTGNFELNADAGNGPGDVPHNGVTKLVIFFDITVMGAYEEGGDPAVNADWTFYFDDINLVGLDTGGDTGGDGCSCDTGGSGALYDFEGGPASVDFDFFDGGMGEIVGNPDTVGNSSAYVVELKKAAGQPWGGGGVLVDPAIDLEANAVFTAKVWSQRAVPVTFKFESDDGAVQTFSVPHGGTGWEDLTFDTGNFELNADAGNGPGDVPHNGVTKLVIFFDITVMGAYEEGGDPAVNADWTFYFDDINLVGLDTGGDTGGEPCDDTGGDTGGSGALYDFEGGPASVDFDFFDGGMGEIVDNPDTVGNSSAYVVELKKAAGQPWGGGGVLVDPAIDLEANAVFTAKVWSQRAVPVTFKFESDDGAVQTFSVPHGGTGWEDLTFDTGNFELNADAGNGPGDVPHNGVTKLVIFFDITVMGAYEEGGDPAVNADWTFYFDDIDLVL